jgi:putative acetyltransferase
MSSLFQALNTVAPEQLTIRPMTPADNTAVANLVRTTLEEHQCIGPGFASSDPELDDLYSVYQSPAGHVLDRGYWVISDEAGQVWGGGGFARLKGTRPDEGICELQKMYFHPGLRGRGYGRTLLTFCIQRAAEAGYRTMYLETMPQMESALNLYRKMGFQPLPTYLGDTGHRSCTVFMSRALEKSVAMTD